ncbi:MAG: cell division protein SepF [archaeon]|nr:cell division protein SepF [archaeon]
MGENKMAGFKNIFKRSSNSSTPTSVMKEPKFVEIDWKGHEPQSSTSIRVLSMNDFSDVEGVLDNLRDRNNIIVLKVKPRLMQEKLELKRALKRIQRTCQAIGGDIVGIKEDVILISPPSVGIVRIGAVSESSHELVADSEKSE